MFDAIQFVQNENIFFISKMKFDDLDTNSEIPFYDAKSSEGYQRPPVLSHVRNIAKFFIQEKVPILPSAIIAAINKGEYCFNNGKLELKNKIRIVDGQHRIAGIRELKERSSDRFNSIKDNYEFPIIIMVVDGKDSMEEIDAFINLNNKGKKVKTDLAEELKVKKHEMMIANKDNIVLSDELYKDISIKIVKKLNGEGFWKDMIIQADENGYRTSQPISILAFFRAIKPAVKSYIEGYFLTSKKETINKNELSEVETQLQANIEEVWNAVLEKWKNCFTEGAYNPNYNICKGIGVTPIYRLYSEFSGKENGMSQFKEILHNSHVSSEDWVVGGIFSGYASAKGFSMIEKYIKGELSSEDFKTK